VRDDESYKLLWKINRGKATKVDDLAIDYLRGLSDEDIHKANLPKDVSKLMSSLRENDNLIVGVSIKPVKEGEINNKIVNEFTSAINLLSSKYQGKLHFIFFPFAKTRSKMESDEEFTQMVCKGLAGFDNVTILGHSDPLSWFLIMKHFVDIFVGMRFHSIIFASEAGKPVLCVPYERKINEFVKSRRADPAISAIALEDLESSQLVSYVEDQIKRIPQRETVK
jgi:polysaccharide pyruvyl transferase WcaK-like protein